MANTQYDIKISMQARELAAGVKTAKGNLKELKTAFKDTLAVLSEKPPKGMAVTQQIKDARAQVALLIKEIEKLQAAGKTNISQAPATTRASISSGTMQARSLISQAAPSTVAANELKAQEAQMKAVAKASAELQSKSITLRYAMYDVGSAAQTASTTMLGYSTAMIKAAADQESAFSQIQKTLVGEVGAVQLEKLRKELVDLSTTVPVTFADLTKIGMLGSQLGIASKDIASFTEVTAKFTAITGMSAEEAAMGFGKLQNLLGLSGDQFQALGSAIAYVGVETAATEQQIINTGGQIAAVGKAAGLSASEIIGLSAAFASLKIAPEEARGVMITTFNQINGAVLTFSDTIGRGNEKLEAFARVAGISSADFAKGWSDKSPEGATKVWEKFVTGLSTKNISQELRRLDLDGVRTSKGLTALAGSADKIFGKGGILDKAKTSGAQGTFLDESFSTILEDLNSKIKMMQSSWENLLAAGGSDGSFLTTIGFVIDSITNLNKALTSMIEKNSVIAGILQFVLVFGLLAGAITAIIAPIAISIGGFLALRTAFAAASVDGILFQGTLMGTIAKLFGVSATAKLTASSFVGIGAGANVAAGGLLTAAGALRVFKLALVATGIGAAVVLLGELAAMLMETFSPAEDAAAQLDKLTDADDKLAIATQKATQELIDFVDQALEPVSSLHKIEASLYSLGEALAQNGNDFSQYSVAGRANMAALLSTIGTLTAESKGNGDVLAANLRALMEYMIGAGLGTAAAFDAINKAILETGSTAAASKISFASVADGLDNVTTSAGKAKTAMELMTEAFDKAFAKMTAQVDLQAALDDFGASLAENGKGVDRFTKEGRANFNSLKDVIFGLKDQLGNKPQSLANSLASLKVAMLKMGITSKFAFDMVDKAMKATGKKGKELKSVIDSLFGAISSSAQQIEIKTLTDYVSDLSNVLSAAFNNRYAKQDTQDSISSAWSSIRQSAEDAKESIDAANRSINEMKADKNVLDYQLKVAIRYGDALRAESIKAKLAKLDADLIGKQKDLTEAQDKANKTLLGNSDAAIANRSTVRNLVKNYNDYLIALANTGMSTEDLKTEANKLKNEFLAQGTALGFAADELDDYTRAFAEDFTTIINGLPKDITLTVNDNPALRALEEFVAKANAILAGIIMPTLGIGGGFAPSPGNLVPGPENPGAERGDLGPGKNWVWTGSKWVKVTSEKGQSIVGSNTPKGPTAAEIAAEKARIAAEKAARKAQQERLKNKLGTVFMSNGGFVKPKYLSDGGMARGTDTIPAMLSPGEYVLKANAVKYYGTDFMNSLNQMQVQGSSSAITSSTSNIVSLSPDDRALLRAAIDRPISLYTENSTIATSANTGNVILAQRGSR